MSNQIDDYIAKQKSPQKEICKSLRSLITNTFPDISEGMKWGVPVFAGGKFYIVALKDHVNLGFSIQGLTADDEVLSLFTSGGKTTRHIEISDPHEMDEERIIGLLKLIDAKVKG